MFGLGLAIAVFVDATLVRMVLVPATMACSATPTGGCRGWLDRLLPHMDLEGGDFGTASAADEATTVGPSDAAAGEEVIDEPELELV